MGKLLVNAQVIVNGVDLTDHCSSVEVSGKAADVETTAMGAAGKSRMPGLKDEQFKINWRQDFAAAKVDATLQPLYAAGTSFAVEVRPTIAARSTTNPAYYAASCYLTEYTPITGTVGSVMDVPTVILVDGQSSAIQRLTS